jgi:hypothetical protein
MVNGEGSIGIYEKVRQSEKESQSPKVICCWFGPL